MKANVWVAIGLCASSSLTACGDVAGEEGAAGIGSLTAAVSRCPTAPPHPCAGATCTQSDDGTWYWEYSPYPAGTACGQSGQCNGESYLCFEGCTNQRRAAATGTLEATPANVSSGLSTTLRWSVSVWSACQSELKLDGAAVGASGYQPVTPTTNTTHTLSIGSRTLASVLVTVTPSNEVHIDGSTPDWVSAFVEAVGVSGKTIILGRDVDLDLTGQENIAFGSVTVTSGDPSLRNAHSLGPRIHTTSRPVGPSALFSIACNGTFRNANNTRLLGFRLEGPTFGSIEGDGPLPQGIHIGSCNGIEIANMEISGWSGEAIQIEDTAVEGGFQTSVDAVKIHDNFIHDNTHDGGPGYGVGLSTHGHATIERNVFDFNRHAVMSAGQQRNTYLARQNLVLKGGGLHNSFWFTYTHQFDVHGTDTCWGYDAGCGDAGYEFWITGNAFQYANDNAVKIRGTPLKLATITGNVFTQGDIDDAVGTTQGLEHIQNLPNTLGVDTFGDYGVCDFDGDGRDDLFLATGVSWWYASGADMHWVYLAPNTERLSQVGLGDFDHDGRCDVFAINTGNSNWEIASGGSGPWSALPGNYPGIAMSQLRFGDFNGDRVTDIFYRADDGQWWAISPGHDGWTPLASSSYALSTLRLGDFNGDGVTDVLSRVGGHWSVSWGGTAGWQSTGSGLNDDLQSLYIGNVDGIAGDDVLRYVPTGRLTAQWEISSGAKTPWTVWARFTFAEPGRPLADPSTAARTFIGRFHAPGTSDVLMIDYDSRRGQLFSAGTSGFFPYSRYAY